MRESYREGVPSHPGPQPCEGGRKAALEAWERGIRRQGIELRNQLIPGADAVRADGRPLEGGCRRAPDADDRLIDPEAYTPYAAAEAAERLAAGYGLPKRSTRVDPCIAGFHPAPAHPGSAPGRIVYVYRAPVPAPAARPATTATAT